MTQHNAIKLFESKKIRTVWDDKEEKWYFSIVDVVAVLTDSPNPRKYWSVLKTRLKKEGSGGCVKMTHPLFRYIIIAFSFFIEYDFNFPVISLYPCFQAV
ncbi:hypothetical protein [uncultured Bacteroides sp.]|uniref:hypothetical protein n=1 Tax=uncultured Bacteroides sp. TaxID=162156 RepID=UPI00260D8B9C|nr:hypothetical protein [uncultured Bacteroides sp.]